MIRVVSSAIEPSIIPTGLIESAPSHMLSSIENRGTLEIKGKKSAEGPGRTYDILSILNPDSSKKGMVEQRGGGSATLIDVESGGGPVHAPCPTQRVAKPGGGKPQY